MIDEYTLKSMDHKDLLIEIYKIVAKEPKATEKVEEESTPQIVFKCVDCGGDTKAEFMKDGNSVCGDCLDDY